MLEGAAQVLGHRREVGGGRHRVETADADVDRMDRPAADDLLESVPRFLQRQSALDGVAVRARHGNDIGGPEEVRGVQHVHVQRVAVNPLPAVQQPAQGEEFVRQRHTTGILDRVAGAGLIGHRADAADPCGDIRRFVVGTAAQERLEEPGWFVDV